MSDTCCSCDSKTDLLLSDLEVGDKATITAINNRNRALLKRLLDMGLTRGVTLTVKQKSPLGDPISIFLRGYTLCLRKEDMEQITVEKIEDKKEEEVLEND